MPPKGRIACGVESDGSRLIGVGIEIVIADERGDARPAINRAKKERAALALARAAVPQLKYRPRPERYRNVDRAKPPVMCQDNLHNSIGRKILRGSPRWSVGASS